MPIEFPAVIEFGLERTATLLTRGFADYYVPISFTETSLLQMVQSDSIDLAASRVVVWDGSPVGAALIARRGWTSRLAGMAIVPEARCTGVGRALMVQLLADARARRDRSMVLEVIEQNERAVRLYETMGFGKLRRLVSFSGPGVAEGAVEEALTEVDLRLMAQVVTREGLLDLPWQLSGETLACLTPPYVAYKLNGAWVALSSVTAPQISIRGLVTERECRRNGQALAILREVMARYPGKEWKVSALWPEELGGVFVSAGLGRGALSQWQMVRKMGSET